MMGFLIFVHSVICIFLAAMILIQSGKGGGLSESFSSAESILGAQTNTFLVKTTTILTSLFFITCISLAVVSARRDRSLMTDKAIRKQNGPISPAVQPLADLPITELDITPKDPAVESIPIPENIKSPVPSMTPDRPENQPLSDTDSQ